MMSSWDVASRSGTHLDGSKLLIRLPNLTAEEFLEGFPQARITTNVVGGVRRPTKTQRVASFQVLS